MDSRDVEETELAQSGGRACGRVNEGSGFLLLSLEGTGLSLGGRLWVRPWSG